MTSKERARIKNRDANRRWRVNNPGAQAAAVQRYAERHPERVRAKDRRRVYKKYGLSEDQYNAMREAQGGICAVPGCGGNGRLLIDHDHQTGAVRGLICYGCNTALGMTGDSLDRLIGLVRYLEKAS